MDAAALAGAYFLSTTVLYFSARCVTSRSLSSFRLTRCLACSHLSQELAIDCPPTPAAARVAPAAPVARAATAAHVERATTVAPVTAVEAAPVYTAPLLASTAATSELFSGDEEEEEVAPRSTRPKARVTVTKRSVTTTSTYTVRGVALFVPVWADSVRVCLGCQRQRHERR